MLRTKRVYESASPGDGRRILIDRLWPRGISKAGAQVDEWRRELAPSPELRIWFGHDPARFARFRERYRSELEPHRAELTALAREARTTTLTLVFGARDPEHCNATVLRELLEELSGSVPRRPRPTRGGRCAPRLP